MTISIVSKDLMNKIYLLSNFFNNLLNAQYKEPDYKHALKV
jgi:hypothetical protein